MMRRAMLVAVALSCLLVAGHAWAGFYTGNQLLDECQGDLSSAKYATCLGYIMGFVDALEGGIHFARTLE